jgi:hypothetical protein
MEHPNRTHAPPPLDWTDPAAIFRWLDGLRVAFADADAVALDMLKPPRTRDLGPALHARNYGEARTAVLAALAAAPAPAPR